MVASGEAVPVGVNRSNVLGVTLIDRQHRQSGQKGERCFGGLPPRHIVGV